jgi:hypothetical protein
MDYFYHLYISRFTDYFSKNIFCKAYIEYLQCMLFYYAAAFFLTCNCPKIGSQTMYETGIHKVTENELQILSKYLRFQVLTTVSMKFRVFWDVVPCFQVVVDRSFMGVIHHPDDGGSTHL